MEKSAGAPLVIPSLLTACSSTPLLPRVGKRVHQGGVDPELLRQNCISSGVSTYITLFGGLVKRFAQKFPEIFYQSTRLSVWNRAVV